MKGKIDTEQATEFVREYLLKKKEVSRKDIGEKLRNNFGLEYNKSEKMLTKIKKEIESKTEGFETKRTRTGEVWYLR